MACGKKSSIRQRREKRNKNSMRILQYRSYSRGDLIIVDLGKRKDRMAFGRTVCVFVGNERNASRFSSILVIPIVKRVNETYADDYVLISEKDCHGYHGEGYLQTYGIKSVNKRCVLKRIGRIKSEELMEAIDEAILTQIGMDDK